MSELKERIKGRLGDLLPLKYGKSLPAAVRDSTGSVPVYGSSGVVGNHSAALTSGPAIIVGRKGNEVTLLPGGMVCSHLGFPGVMVEDVGELKSSTISKTVLLLVFLTACRYDKILIARPLAKNCFSFLLKAAGENFFFPFVDSVIYAVGLKDAANLFHKEGGSEVSQTIGALFPAVAYVAAQRYGEVDQWISLSQQELIESTDDAHRFVEPRRDILGRSLCSLVLCSCWSTRLMACR